MGKASYEHGSCCRGGVGDEWQPRCVHRCPEIREVLLRTAIDEIGVDLYQLFQPGACLFKNPPYILKCGLGLQRDIVPANNLAFDVNRHLPAEINDIVDLPRVRELKTRWNMLLVHSWSCLLCPLVRLKNAGPYLLKAGSGFVK